MLYYLAFPLLIFLTGVEIMYLFEEPVFVIDVLVLDLGVLGVKHLKDLSDLRAMFLSTTSRNTASDLIYFLFDTLFTVKNHNKM